MTDDDKALLEALARIDYWGMGDEIDNAMTRIKDLSAENERLTYNGIHSCHDQCERPLCVVERENNRLREAMTWIKNNSDNRSVHYRVAREALGETK